MVDKDLHSTDLSVSGDKEGHSTILLTHDIFFVFNWGQSYLATLVRHKIAHKWLEILLLLFDLHYF